MSELEVIDPRERDEPGPVRTDVLVSRVTLLARDVISLELVDPAGDTLPRWEPGAHIDLVLPSGTVRQYSLCGDVDDRNRYRIAVLREPQSRGGSTEVHDSGLVGKTIGMVGPRNNFELQAAERYLFIAGGIGITPILSMIVRAERDGVPWTLLYGARSPDRLAFGEEIARRRGGEKAIVYEDAEGHPDLETALSGATAGTAVYCCGPPGMLEAAQEIGQRLLPPGALRVERFTGVSVAPAPRADDASFEVELARTGVTLTVPSDRTILDVVLDAVPGHLYSCEEGHCGTCRTRVLAGEPDHRDTVLDDDERAEYMMICVGRSRSERLVLDL